MKRIFILTTIAILLYSCANKIETLPVAEQIDVKFALTGEYAELQSQSSRVSLTDVLAIQVYQRTDEGGAKYKPYCYGLWDKISEVTLKLNKDFLYRVEATFIPNAKSLIAVTTPDGAMKQPFAVYGTGGDSRVANRSIYSTSNYLSGISQGTTALISGKSYNIFSRPTINRYYGEVNDIVAFDGLHIDMEVRRVAFGLKYEVVGFSEGELEIELKNAPVIVLTQANHASLQTIITFQGSTFETNEWTNDNYTESVSYAITWKKVDGTVVKIANKETNFQRKMLYNMKIDLRETHSSGNVNIKVEDGDLGDGGDV